MVRAWLLFLLLLPSPARADEPHREAYLTCDPGHDRFVIRFGLRYNEAPAETADLAPTSLPDAQQLQGQPFAGEGSCTLANGTKVELGFAEAQAFGHGQGGGDPNATFTLSFDGTALYFRRTFYSGYGSSTYDLSAVAYESQTLLACPGPAAGSEPPTPAPCRDESSRLQALSEPFPERFDIYSDEEKTQLIDDLRRRQLTARLSPFCQELERVEKFFVSFAPDESSPLESAQLDINNDGKADRVVRVADDNHYFDGSFLVVYPGGETGEPGEDTLIDIDPEDVRTVFASSKWPAVLISLNENVSPRYSRNEVFAYEGKNYVLSSTAKTSMIPAKVVSILSAKTSMPKTLCEYP